MENINATNITARINVIEPVPNVDINYGPYDNTEIAQQTLDQYGVWDENAIGLTVGVWKDSTHKKVEEYQLIKNNSGNLELTLKQAEVTPGITDYSALTGKPSINNHELSSGNNTLASIGAASASALSSHTSDSKIHVPMTYGGTTTAITGFKIEGEKMTITVGSSEYSFRLTEWRDIPDYYVLFGNPVFDDAQNDYVIQIDGVSKTMAQITGDDILSLASSTEERNGYVITSTKQKFPTNNYGTLNCDYTTEITEIKNAMFILFRKSNNTFNSLKTVISTYPGLSDVVVYNTNGIPNVGNVDDFNTWASFNKTVTIGDEQYQLKTVYDSGQSGLRSNKFGIMF
jgi:hypothetical protein